MEQSGLIESDCKVILLFEKAQKEESHKVVISMKIERGPFIYNFIGAVGRERLSSSEVRRDRKRTAALTGDHGVL